MEGSAIWRNPTGPTAVRCDALQVWLHAWAASMVARPRRRLLEILQPVKIYGCKAASMDGEAPAALAATKQERGARNGPHEGAPPLCGRNNCDSTGCSVSWGSGEREKSREEWGKWGSGGSGDTPTLPPLLPFPQLTEHPRGITVVTAA